MCVHMHHTCRENTGERENCKVTMFKTHPAVPQLTEPAGGLQLAAKHPQPGSTEAAPASGTALPTDMHTATRGGRAGRSPSKRPEVSETLAAKRFMQSAAAHRRQLKHRGGGSTVRHDGPYEARAPAEAVLPLLPTAAVVTHKHTPLQGRHQPTPLQTGQKGCCYHHRC